MQILDGYLETLRLMGSVIPSRRDDSGALSGRLCPVFLGRALVDSEPAPEWRNHVRATLKDMSAMKFERMTFGSTARRAGAARRSMNCSSAPI